MARYSSAVGIYGGDKHRVDITNTVLHHKVRPLNSFVTRIQVSWDVAASRLGTPEYLNLQQYRCENVKPSSLRPNNKTIHSEFYSTFCKTCATVAKMNYIGREEC
jgi:hypothetical protein